MMWLGVYLFGVYWGGSFFTEQDASWHQVIIRDTSFTPSHVVVFYGSFPMYIVCGVATYLYAMTRLPLYSRGTSFPLVMAIAGPLMILPNVGLNEWGHAFWFMEELFSAPLHWGFVVLGWSGLFCRRHCCTDHHPLLQPDRRRLERTEQSHPQQPHRTVKG